MSASTGAALGAAAGAAAGASAGAAASEATGAASGAVADAATSSARARAGADAAKARWYAALGKFRPFADAASESLPWDRLLRLSLFQVSVGMALVLLNGTLNRVMIVELGVPAWLVASMVALPLLFAPFRALVGFRSDHHRSAIGWRRVPYIWIGSLIQFGGFAIMPFALLLLSGDGNAPVWVARTAAALAFLLVGVGMHVVQTAGLALATDLAPEEKRPQVVAALYVTLLVGTLVSALVFGALLSDFTQIRLIQVVQGAAMVTIVLNCIALWKQESRRPTDHLRTPRPSFVDAWRGFDRAVRGKRFLVAVSLGTMAFAMQEILLEPYGGEILGLSVGATTFLTAILAIGGLAAFVLAARVLDRGTHPMRLASLGALVGIAAFSLVIFAEPLASATLFRAGTLLIGFGGGLFAVGTLAMAMAMARGEHAGLSLGVWGAAQATAAGVGIALGGFLRDAFSELAVAGSLGSALQAPATGYSVVYHLEIALLFVTLVALGPLVSLRPGGDRTGANGATGHERDDDSPRGFGLSDFPT